MKCELDKAKKNEPIEIVCKVHIGFGLVEAFIIEEKIMQKKNKELFIINRKEFDFDDDLKQCGDYYTAKIETVKNRQSSAFSLNLLLHQTLFLSFLFLPEKLLQFHLNQ